MEAAAATVGESAYRAVRADIIFGRLAPSERVRLEKARTTYGVSVSTLREILNRLTSEGFVLAEGQRGFQVASVSPEGFREVAAMRLLLECHALERSLARGDIEWEACVVAAYHKLSTAERTMVVGDRGMSETWKRYDREFHRAIISACGSEVLIDAHAAVYDQYLRYQMVAVIYRGDVAAREHRTLFESAIGRDLERARATLEQHINDCVTDALARPDAPWLGGPGGRSGARERNRPPPGGASRIPTPKRGRKGAGVTSSRARAPGRE